MGCSTVVFTATIRIRRPRQGSPGVLEQLLGLPSLPSLQGTRNPKICTPGGGGGGCKRAGPAQDPLGPPYGDPGPPPGGPRGILGIPKNPKNSKNSPEQKAAYGKSENLQEKNSNSENPQKKVQ